MKSSKFARIAAGVALATAIPAAPAQSNASPPSVPEVSPPRAADEPTTPAAPAQPRAAGQRIALFGSGSAPVQLPPTSRRPMVPRCGGTQPRAHKVRTHKRRRC